MSTTTSSASASATTTGVSAALTMPPQFKIVGIVLAVLSGLLIGSSFVLKKVRTVVMRAPPAEYAFRIGPESSGRAGGRRRGVSQVAYAFVEAIVVTPLGALSVVVCAIMSSFFLNEKLTFFGWVGCFLCIVGSVIIALNGPKESSVGEIREFQKYFLSVGFLVYAGLAIAAAIVIVFFVAPKYGKKSMLWYITVCSLIGGLSVSCTQALGSSIVLSIRGQNQFTYWFTYFVLVFVIVTLGKFTFNIAALSNCFPVVEVYYLNMALALFNTAMVTPTYYVLFTFCTLVTSVILYQGLHASVTAIITVVMGFLVICAGITILQMSKVDPTTLSNLDRKSTILLAANRQTQDAEKGDSSAIEEPGVDAIRGSFGAIGSIIRARSIASSKGTIRSRHAVHGHSRDDSGSTMGRLPSLGGMKRHQLFDNPVPPMPEDAAERISMYSHLRPISERTDDGRKPTIQFRQADLAGHDHLSADREGQQAELALDDFIQRTTSPLNPPVASPRQLYDDPYAPRAGFRPHAVRQDSLASLPGTGTNSPDHVESPPRAAQGRFQRTYPQDREMDREETMSLVGAREMGFDQQRDSEELTPGVTNGGIRLLPSLPRR